LAWLKRSLFLPFFRASPTHDFKSGMRIHVGIMRELCRKVHFIATSSAIQFSRSCGGIYRLNCPAPRSESREFRKEHVHPYRAADDVFQRGSATEGEYEPLPCQRSPLNYLIA
jgi:hypothetical protein